MKIKCPKCGTVRIVQEGKSKNCRKCRTVLTTVTPKPKKPIKLSALEITESFPAAVKEIKSLAIEEFKQTFSGEGGDGPTVESFKEHFPDLAYEIAETANDEAVEKCDLDLKAKLENGELFSKETVLALTHEYTTAKEASDEKFEENDVIYAKQIEDAAAAQVLAVSTAVEKIGKLSVNKFTDQFPDLSEKIGKAAVRAVK